MTKTEEAILYAVFAHAGATRKGKAKPYVLHPLEAMTIAAGVTEDEDVLAAAALHDVVEDTSATREDVRRLFGERVAALVAAESEDKREDRPAAETWQLRKQETVDHLRELDRDAKLICLGDKLSNLREIARDYEKFGEEFWQRFNQQDPAMHGWYYRSIFKVLEEEFGGTDAIAEYRALLDRVFGPC